MSEEIEPPGIPPDDKRKPRQEFSNSETYDNREAEPQPTADNQPTPEPTPMEVHHHGHIHSKSKWKEYFFQFFMLFLAVFCGFLAEYQLEHKIESDREKLNIKELVENLKYDIIRYDKNFINNIEITKGLDSLRTELKYAITGSGNNNALYYFSLKYAGQYSEAVVNTSAIMELKHSGNMRLLNNQKLVSELGDYYERKVYAAREKLPTAEQNEALKGKGDEIFSFLGLDDYISSFDTISETTYKSSYNFQNIHYYQPPLQLLKYDPKDLETYYTMIVQSEIRLKQYNFWLALNKKSAEKLIGDIQKEYNLE